MPDDPIPLTGRDAIKLKERMAQGLTILLDLLEADDHGAQARRMAPYATLGTLMTEAPEAVQPLLDLAWELREADRLSPLFRLDEGEPAVVQGTHQSIKPCDRSFDEVVVFALRETARAFFERAGNDWAIEQAETARARWRAQERARGAAPLARLVRLFRRTPEPVFDPADFRDQAPQNGLYEALEPFLEDPGQFALVRAYSGLTRSKVAALGDMLRDVRDPGALQLVASMTGEDLPFLQNCARVCATSHLAAEARGGAPAPEGSVEDLTARLFADLLGQHPDLARSFLGAGKPIEASIRVYAPLFGTGTWAVMADPEASRNAVNVPDPIQPLLGPLCQYVSPEVSRAWQQMSTIEIIHDLLELALKEFPRDELIGYLSDPERVPVWASLPRRFNNQFNYKRNAPPANSTRNFEDLKVVASGIFESLRQGKVL
ncbi:hypothetical protein IHV25_00590 [Phaeovibrio sulfidiphilus]|uniref:Uncharacterized protein n=1 Tax=Phaeovibrio sulfidiphilus TaxID=1220600 RepID=A0A8J6YH25_9PROT|nr:hypothetical protein [Phaeovibrio sulfidiphilus]MBE1236156.1 hypothetical protein [Phaeovibrio sulfidiphilus]